MTSLLPDHSSRDARRARSAEPGYYDDEYDDRRSTYGRNHHHDRDRSRDRSRDRDSDRRSHRKAESVYYEEEEKKKVRMLSKQEQIIAAITGAAIAIGGKELYDRREANSHGTDVHRNIMAFGCLGAAGAFASYQGTEFYNKRKEKEEKKSTYMVHRGRDGTVSEYYSDEEDAKEKKGHKNFLENALAAAGLGGAVKALTGGSSHKDDKSDTRSRRGSRSRSRSKEKGPPIRFRKRPWRRSSLVPRKLFVSPSSPAAGKERKPSESSRLPPVRPPSTLLRTRRRPAASWVSPNQSLEASSATASSTAPRRTSKRIRRQVAPVPAPGLLEKGVVA